MRTQFVNFLPLSLAASHPPRSNRWICQGCIFVFLFLYFCIARYQEAKLVELNIEHRTPRGYSTHCWLCLGFAILCAGENPFYFASKLSREVGTLLYMYDVVFLIIFAILLKEDYTIHTLTYNITLLRNPLPISKRCCDLLRTSSVCQFVVWVTWVVQLWFWTTFVILWHWAEWKWTPWWVWTIMAHWLLFYCRVCLFVWLLHLFVCLLQLAWIALSCIDFVS